MQAIDEIPEIVGIAEPRGRSVIAGDLVSHDPSKGCSAMGRSWTCVKLKSRTWAASRGAISRHVNGRLFSSGTRAQDPRCTS